ncbi:hypothetical protein CBS147333_481 [Penicillium roqueforti]|uniref:uncharacterized protein n=1 Tax=Penicillium roqueforti TaxID=5082 RepID=UPI00190D3E3B|nr:uncharacterized protein LCP9604111_2149 [Penicillium roqueforti]KAF9252153.1 hypothetical protein LCP9604111_2149 [Penicillium roqueforti]KAI2687860.1 hypothetical protein LCP963914a_3378 [Penicillium roqueforti]KAI2689763.1 hypothetical protein CBS147355_214 [Penicillium roqueforti]KAI3116857.1 hypothetical protein CBS147333_481 [Penicillium roqueforti]KAI3272903.1 hypothetical protein CBS147308_3523 [Penicillium roqueforti]
MPPRKSKKKQTRLAFAASAASPSADASPESSRYATLTYDHPSLGTYRPPKSLNSESGTSPASKRPKLPAKTRSKDKPTNELFVEKSSHESLDETIIPASQKRKQVAPPDNLDPVNLDDAQDSKNSRSRKSQQSLECSRTDSESTNGSDSEELSRPRRSLKRRAPSSPIDSSDSDEPVASSAPNRRRSTRGGHSSSSPVILSGDDSNESVAPSTAKRRRVARPAVVSESDEVDSDEPLASSPVKRLRRGKAKESPQAPHTPRHISQQARLDIAEDLEDLQDSVVKKNRTRGRNVESARDKRMKHLEALRRRRAGMKDEEEEQEDEEDDDDEEESDPDVQEIKQPSVRSLWRHDDGDSDIESAIDPNENLDRYEDDFVLEDEANDLGVPTEELPFEFTRHAYKQPKEYFRDVIGWMVQNKLNPAFPRSDDMYKMAFMKLEDEVKGRAGSQLISSVWNPSFIYALQARPHMEVDTFPTEDNHPCDACRRSGHPASREMKLYGKAYSLQTLEPLEDDSDEDSNNDDDGNDRDRDGHVIPPENVRYYLGKQCNARAQLTHTLTHWRYHLNEWVIDFLERTGHMDADEILRRNDMSVKRKTRNANDVLDSMTGSGEVDKLWRDFHIKLKSAREKESIYG